MTNREKLLNTNIYDLLVTMNKNIDNCATATVCILDIIAGKDISCIPNVNYSCEECIQEYLNMEV